MGMARTGKRDFFNRLQRIFYCTDQVKSRGFEYKTLQSVFSSQAVIARLIFQKRLLVFHACH
jgi:hypothetical protein